MKSINYWNIFSQTGSVDDYLRYKSEERSDISGRQEAAMQNNTEKEAGTRKGHAGFRIDNGNDTKDSAYQ